MPVNKGVLIDRDDTICRDVGYCRRPEDLTLLPGSAEGIRLFNENGFKVVVVTNQSGIARGYLDEPILWTIHQKMTDDLAECGAHIDAIYYCPHHPDDGCQCRKPGTEMGKRAIMDMDIDPASSFVVGDRLLDMVFAKNLGIKGVFIRNRRGEEELAASGIVPDLVASDLTDAAKLILASQ